MLSYLLNFLKKIMAEFSFFCALLYLFNVGNLIQDENVNFNEQDLHSKIEQKYEIFHTYILIQVICAIVIVLSLLLLVAYAILLERKVLGSIQRRRGPNLVGFLGLLQPIADAIKLIVKETIVPVLSNKIIFIIAPLLTLILSLLNWSIIPFSSHSVFADIRVSILMFFALSSLTVYGIIMSGWASNSKYAFLGALRAAAQVIAYEVSIGLTLIYILIQTGNLNYFEIIWNQICVWNIVPCFIFFFLFFISTLAETNRPPFDLPEAEAELVSGYNVEYSAMAFGFFFLGEYVSIWTVCCLNIILFWGGFLIFFAYESIFFFSLKVIFLVITFIWVRGSLPRYRYDQLMRLGWKILLPLSLGFVILYSGLYYNYVFSYLNEHQIPKEIIVILEKTGPVNVNKFIEFFDQWNYVNVPRFSNEYSEYLNFLSDLCNNTELKKKERLKLYDYLIKSNIHFVKLIEGLDILVNSIKILEMFEARLRELIELMEYVKDVDILFEFLDEFDEMEEAMYLCYIEERASSMDDFNEILNKLIIDFDRDFYSDFVINNIEQRILVSNLKYFWDNLSIFEEDLLSEDAEKFLDINKLLYIEKILSTSFIFNSYDFLDSLAEDLIIIIDSLNYFDEGVLDLEFFMIFSDTDEEDFMIITDLIWMNIEEELFAIIELYADFIINSINGELSESELKELIFIEGFLTTYTELYISFNTEYTDVDFIIDNIEKNLIANADLYINLIMEEDYSLHTLERIFYIDAVLNTTIMFYSDLSKNAFESVRLMDDLIEFLFLHTSLSEKVEEIMRIDEEFTFLKSLFLENLIPEKKPNDYGSGRLYLYEDIINRLNFLTEFEILDEVVIEDLSLNDADVVDIVINKLNFLSDLEVLDETFIENLVIEPTIDNKISLFDDSLVKENIVEKEVIPKKVTNYTAAKNLLSGADDDVDEKEDKQLITFCKVKNIQKN